MPEDFAEISNQSIRAPMRDIVAIGNVLKNELPFDYLKPSWHIEGGTDNCALDSAALAHQPNARFAPILRPNKFGGGAPQSRSWVFANGLFV
jgi:hypothetical protein